MKDLLCALLVLALSAPMAAQDSRKKNIVDLLNDQTYKAFHNCMAATPDDWM